MVVAIAVAKELAAALSRARTSGSASAVETDPATWSHAPIKVPKASLISSSVGPSSDATLR